MWKVNLQVRKDTDTGYRMPYSWVQCKCGRQSARFVDGYEQVDPEAVRAAIDDWNERCGRKENEQDH